MWIKIWLGIDPQNYRIETVHTKTVNHLAIFLGVALGSLGYHRYHLKTLSAHPQVDLVPGRRNRRTANPRAPKAPAAPAARGRRIFTKKMAEILQFHVVVVQRFLWIKLSHDSSNIL